MSVSREFKKVNAKWQSAPIEITSGGGVASATAEANEVRWVRIGDMVTANYYLYQTTTGTDGTAAYSFKLPVAARLGSNTFLACGSAIVRPGAGGTEIGTAVINSASSFQILSLNETNASGTVGGGGSFRNGLGVAMEYNVSITYEAA